MLFLARWISQGSRWFSSLLVRIFGATPWLLNRAVAKDKESGQDAGTVHRAAAQLQEPAPTAINSLPALREKVISGGSTGIVYLLPSGYARKSAYPDAEGRRQSLGDIEREYKIYERLPQQHDRLLKMISYSPEDGIILEYMPNGNLRNYLRLKAAKLDLAQRLQWACDAAEALHLVHSYNIIHCDVKPENFLLDTRLRLQIIDFSGSSIDGLYASAFESVRFCLPRPWEAPSTIATDVFALGSTIYEIMTSTQPYMEHTDEEVEDLFRQGEFPVVDNLPCGELIQRLLAQRDSFS